MQWSQNKRRTRVKFCGITSAADATAAATAGADAIGLIFHPPATVYVDPSAASDVVAGLPPFVDIVAVFANADTDVVWRTIEAIRPQYLQFHGSETATYCQQFKLPYLKSCRVSSGADMTATQAAHPACRGLLLDSYAADRLGGTGQSFDWSLIPPESTLPLIVAGGLTAATVGDLIRQVRPWGVDVSTGIAEAGDVRRKNWDKMTAFMRSIYESELF